MAVTLSGVGLAALTIAVLSGSVSSSLAANAISSPARNSDSALPAQPRSADIVIQQASYGVLDDPMRTRDVTEKMQELVDAGVTTFLAGGLSKGDDPAPMVVKTLKVDYAVAGESRSAACQDLETITLSPAKIVIQQAIFGALDDPNRTRDVTKEVQALVDSGIVAFPVDKITKGNDPAYGVVKTLKVDYTVDGKALSVSKQDSETIALNPAKIVVQKARYGALEDPERTRDVTTNVQAFIDVGVTAFPVGDLAIEDPAFMVLKTLEVDYTVDGMAHHAIGEDRAPISLFPPGQ